MNPVSHSLFIGGNTALRPRSGISQSQPSRIDISEAGAAPRRARSHAGVQRSSGQEGPSQEFHPPPVIDLIEAGPSYALPGRSRGPPHNRGDREAGRAAIRNLPWPALRLIVQRRFFSLRIIAESE